MAAFRWQFVNDSSAIAWQELGHPHKPVARAWISVTDPDDMNRVRIAVERALDYGKVPDEVKRSLRGED